MQSEKRVTLLAGGVGGSRLAVGFDLLTDIRLTVIVNVADDDVVYGQYVAADLDTMTYTLAGEQGDAGWGRRDDGWTVMTELARLGLDTSFRLGDADLAVTMYRTLRLAEGCPLSTATAEIARQFGVRPRLLPASDQPIRTRLTTTGGEDLAFQDYFVVRRHRDQVAGVRYEGLEQAAPGPDVIEAIEQADLVVVAPSNPILSILPITGISQVYSALAGRRRVVAISPLVGGRAVKGPTVELMASLGYPPGNDGMVEAYTGFLSHLVVDDSFTSPRVETRQTDTVISRPDQAARLAQEVVQWAL